MVMYVAGLGPENDCWRRPAAIVNDRPILSLERMLHKDYNHKGSVKKKEVLVVGLKGLGEKTN
jgi:hypothetical protein